MRFQAAKGLVALAVSTMTVVTGPSAVALQVIAPGVPVNEGAVVKVLHGAHSSARADKGFVDSKLVGSLCRDAQKHADWMARTGQFVHSGMPYWEVILTGPETAEEAIHSWMKSRDHRKILMSGGEIGFGHAAVDGVTYWVGLVR